jgi:hypothetical protein
MKCCPTSYTCMKDYNFCTSMATTAIEVTLTNPKVVTTVSASSRTVHAFPFIVRYKSSDKPFLGLAPQTAAPTSDDAQDNGGSPDEAFSNAGGLSPGAKIAIGVIVPVVIIIIALVVFCIFLKKRKKPTDEPPVPSGPWGKPELDSAEVELTEQRIYDAKGPMKIPDAYELPNNAVYHEMDSQPIPARY